MQKKTDVSLQNTLANLNFVNVSATNWQFKNYAMEHYFLDKMAQNTYFDGKSTFERSLVQLL